MSRSMVLIHGAWLASNSWENFSTFFGERGYDVTAPEWPRKPAGVAAQREDSDELAGLGVQEIVDHYDAIIRAMDEPPVLVGHSFGGLFVEMLLGRGLGAAGVALDPAAPKGVLRVEPSELKAAGPALNHPLRHNGVVPLTLKQFTYAFVNTFDEDAARSAYERYAVPETARILFQDGLANFMIHPVTKIDYDRPGRAPLLITAGENDNTVPPGVSKAAYKKYDGSPGVTDFIEFAGRPHMLMVGEGWEEVASYVAGWLERNLSEAPAGHAVA